MTPPHIHIVGGFLGSGKTTAIAAAAKQLLSCGKRVGVVTNDQGKYLVDTAFFQLADVPTVEVTGGCFCCNYDDLEAHLAGLTKSAQPDIIFAESVGSCADIVATVVKPLLMLNESGFEPSSFSVFADARLLRHRLQDLPMPFSEDVVYIFDKQIEEAGLLVINKSDLLSVSEQQALLTLARQQFPQKEIRLQSSLVDDDVAEWVDLLESGTISVPDQSLEIDYERYGAGEMEMAWLDEKVTISVSNGAGRNVVVQLLGNLATALKQANRPIGHLKFMIDDHLTQTKISFPTLEESGWEQRIPELVGSEIDLLINARVIDSAENLHTIVQSTLDTTLNDCGAQHIVNEQSSFHPGLPEPIHRL
jgi:Ni2+-binding GTPase involved in maturation of urease and hydrogenase